MPKLLPKTDVQTTPNCARQHLDASMVAAGGLSIVMKHFNATLADRASRSIKTSIRCAKNELRGDASAPA